MNKNLPNWCYALSDEIFQWLMQLQNDQHPPGRFRFCLKGSTFFPSDKSGLDASALALKICYMIGAISKIKKDDLGQWIDFIRSFQHQKERYWFLGKTNFGFFIDHQFISQVDKQSGLFKHNIKVRRAVTRQACAALLCVGSGPKYPVFLIPQDPKAVKKYLTSLDWAKPWDAASHASHLVFFLNINKEFFGIKKPYQECIPVIFDWLNSICKSETGSWYKGSPSLEEKINGAMKVLTAYASINKPIENPKPLIDLCLTAKNTQDACHVADILFVLHYCYRYTKYRQDEVKDFCRKSLNFIEQFKKPDGGFSFKRDVSQTVIYGVPIAKGLAESDIHGTVLLLWCLKMTVDILGLSNEVSWNMPVN